jgi:polyhydroxybutyrate depolymerase
VSHRADLRHPARGGLPLAAVTVFALWASGGCGLALPDLPADGSPGTYSASFQHDSLRREAIVYVPESLSSTEAAPMLLNFHGYGDKAMSFMESADLRPLADDEGFILVYPQGSQLQGTPHWNSAAPSNDNKSDADDFGYVERLIDTVASAYEINADRVYAAGYSNGGMMSFGLACYRGDLIASIAAVSGAMLDDIGVDCTPAHPTSVITLHGTDDSVLPYDGGEGMRSAQAALDYWIEVDEITADPTTSSSNGGTPVESDLYAGGLGGTEVHHHRVVGGEHVWFDLEVDGTDTNGLIWAFVSRFDRDGAL